MRKFLKNSILEIFQTMYEAHFSIKKMIDKKDFENVSVLLEDCQNTAVQIGTSIESSEGEGFVTVGYLEEYCEAVYEVATSISDNYSGNKAQKVLDKKLIKAENSVKNDVKVRLEIVFCPYKASMWDSLESVWKAADEDPDCDAYVVPIPYYDRNPDYSFGEFHYEGGDYPDYVPITHYEAYNFEARRPDVVYIHNPYDEYNNVTSVDPRFYSHELKKYTECLVYIPYYATSGGMSEGQYKLSAYYYADYIIMQSPRFRAFFDAALPDEKLLPLGSPKFDKVINICNNPPEPPAEWKTKMAGKKVYFYNTSLGGMLSNTKMFLHKMQYVFETFAKHSDVCLLWRPHPLLEPTFDSMRPQFKEWFTELKNFFFENHLGIYDNTPDITNTIAMCDVYIGDSSSSVTALFGIAGKPLYILNNRINTEPEEDDWRGELITKYYYDTDERWFVSSKNVLYYSVNNDYKYKFICRISEYTNDSCFSNIISVDNKSFVCPLNSDVILQVNSDGIVSTIQLEKRICNSNAFLGAVRCGKYIFLIPNQYPAIVRFNTKNNSLEYIEGYNDIFIKTIPENNSKLYGGYAECNGLIYISSPSDKSLLAIHPENCKVDILSTGGTQNGCFIMQNIGDELLMLPTTGYTIKVFAPVSGRVSEFNAYVDGLKCQNLINGSTYDEKPFSFAAVYENYIYLPPLFANMFIKINRHSLTAEQWHCPVKQPAKYKNNYFYTSGRFTFTGCSSKSDKLVRLFSYFDRKLYSVDLSNNTSKEIILGFNLTEIEDNNSGFGCYSKYLRYCCEENTSNSLDNLLNHKIKGEPFDKKRQISIYSKIAANNDGTCGIKTHKFIKDKTLI